MNMVFLKYFAMVAQTKSFTRAASLLHISQPTVTQAVKKLETELGVYLLKRNNKQVILTPEGERFLAGITKVIQDYEEAVQSVRDYAMLQRGSIRFAVPPLTSVYIFPEVYNLFTAAYPQLKMVISEDSSSDIVRAKIDNDDADAGIIVATRNASHFGAVVVRKVHLVVCIPFSHPLAKHNVIDINWLRDEKLFLHKSDSYSHRAFVAKCRENHFVPNIEHAFNRIDMIDKMVASGAGISIMTSMVLEGQLPYKIAQLADPMGFDVILAWKNSVFLTDAMRALISLVTKHYAHNPPPNWVDTSFFPPVTK